jgi:hypothetical protein
MVTRKECARAKTVSLSCTCVPSPPRSMSSSPVARASLSSNSYLIINDPSQHCSRLVLLGGAKHLCPHFSIWSLIRSNSKTYHLRIRVALHQSFRELVTICARTVVSQPHVKATLSNCRQQSRSLCNKFRSLNSAPSHGAASTSWIIRIRNVQRFTRRKSI